MDIVQDLRDLATKFEEMTPYHHTLMLAAEKIESHRSLIRQLNQMFSDGELVNLATTDRAALLVQKAFGIGRKIPVGEVVARRPA